MGEKSGKGAKAYLSEYWKPAVLVAVFALLFRMTISSKNAKIDLLEMQLNECEKEHKLLEAERDMLRLSAKSDSAFIICPGNSITFFDDQIMVTLDRVWLRGEPWDPVPQFFISEIGTENRKHFAAYQERYFEFDFGDKKGVLCYLGLEERESKNCARISVIERR